MLKQKASLSFGLNILGSAFGYISLFFVSRYMGPEAIGIIASILSFINLFAILGDFGFSSAHVKRVSEGMHFGKCNGTYFLVKTIITISIGIFSFLTFLFLQHKTKNSYLDPKYINVFYILFISTLFANLIAPVRITFQAKVEKAKEVIPQFIQKIILTVLWPFGGHRSRPSL